MYSIDIQMYTQYHNNKKKDKSDNAFFFEIHEQLKTDSSVFAISS